MGKKEFNPWKRATFILGALILIFGIINVNNIFKEKEILVDLVTPESMCSRINATPSWADYRGNILGVGIQQFNNSFEATNILINESIYFIYNPNCGACIRQIEIFGNDWDKYKESGLTINCLEIN